MDSYSPLLERIRAPQPLLQRFAVISLFDKIRSDAPDSASVGTVVSHCLQSSAAAVVDQTVRELCRLVKDRKMRTSEGLLELQAGLEGCRDPRFVDVFVKGIGFLCRFEFRNNPAWGFEVAENHPFVKVLSSRDEAQPELIQQVILFIAQNRPLGFARSLKFLRAFLMFSLLRIPFSTSSASFMRQLMSSIASLSCSFTPEGMLIIENLSRCLKYFYCKTAEEFKCLIYSAECLVDASIFILQQAVSTKMPVDELQLCGLKLIETLLSLFLNHLNRFGGIEHAIELSKRLLIIQKEQGLRYLPICASILISLFFVLTQAELVHEQLSALKLSLLLLEWKNDAECSEGQVGSVFNTELLLIFPVINLLSSPSKSVKAAAVELVSNLERPLAEFITSKKPVTSTPPGIPPVSKLESITCRLLHHLWLKDQPSSSMSYVLELGTVGTSEYGSRSYDKNLWLSHLRKYSLMFAGKQKPISAPQHHHLLTEIPLLLSVISSILVVHHHTLGSLAVDTLAAVGTLDPKLGLSVLLSILFFSKISCNISSKSSDILLKLLETIPSLASHPIMVPLVIQTILPMLHKDAQLLLHATAVRLLCKTWEFSDRVFEYLRVTLQPLRFSELASERNICISMAASLCDVCKKNPDRGVDLILSVSACIENHDPAVKALGFESIGHLCEADAVDFYTAWDVIVKFGMDYSVHPNVAHSLCNFLRWGAMDAEAYPEASMSVIQLLWEIGTSRYSISETTWMKARSSAFQALTHYEVEHIRRSIPDFSETNLKSLICEDNHEVLRAMESLEIKIITFEHITRRRLIKEKPVMVNKVEKLLEVFPQVMFSSEGKKGSRELPGAALISLSLNPKDTRGQGTSKELLKLYVSYENALTEIAESLPLSRNILVALLSLQSWKSFMHRWLRAEVLLSDSNLSQSGVDKGSKAADDILQRLCAIAEESIPRSAENVALAIGALCMIVPPSAHAVVSTASKFLLNWLFQFEHEHRQWTAAIALGLLSSCLHATDLRQKFEIITGLKEVAANSKSTLVKGACGVGLGFTSQDLLARVDSGDDANSEEGTIGLRETTLLCDTIHSLCSMICKLCPSSFESLRSLCRICLVCTDDIDMEETAGLPGDNNIDLEEDIWGVAGLVLGLADCVVALYRAGAYDAVLKIKDMLVSWIPYVNSSYTDVTINFEKPEVLLSVGSCLALPAVVAFCQRTELMVVEVDFLIDGYRNLICKLLTIKNSETYHQNLLMASCIGAGNFISCILNEGLQSLKVDDVKSMLELMRTTYSKPYPPAVHLGGMFGVVNALGAGAGIPNHAYTQRLSLQAVHDSKESQYVKGPILSSVACEPLCTSLMQEMFLVAQHSKDLQIQRYAAWAVSFLRYRWWSKEFQGVNASKTSAKELKPSSHSFPKESTVMQLCVWLADINTSEMAASTHVNTVTTVLSCLSHAPRLPSLDWGAIIRRCMKYEDQVSSKLNPNVILKEGALREECLLFSLAHANQVGPLLFFLDEVSDVSRFRTLELNLQSSLLLHLAGVIKIFSGSRLEKLFDDMFYYFSSSTYVSYDHDCQNLLRISFWRGLCNALSEISAEAPDYVSGMERCMELLFRLLPAPCRDASHVKWTDSENEWLEAMKCLTKAPKDWLMDVLQVHDMNIVQGSDFIEGVKRISARARLVVTGGISVNDLLNLKHLILNTDSDGIWWALIEIAAALQYAEGSVKRQWILDVVEISCITKYPSAVLRFLGLLSSSFCKYMPLLILDRAAVLSDLPVTLPSLLSDSSWRTIAEPLVSYLWKSTERICEWAIQLATGNVPTLASIDESESKMSHFLAQVMHATCVSVKDFLPFEKQLRLTTMDIP